MNITESYLMANSDKFPSANLPELRNRLSKLDDSQANMVITTPLKSPTTALMLSIFLGYFAIDRFYIGQVGLGLLKLVSLCLWIVFFGWVWYIVDLFLIMGATKKANLEAINAAIATATITDLEDDSSEEEVDDSDTSDQD